MNVGLGNWDNERSVVASSRTLQITNRSSSIESMEHVSSFIISLAEVPSNDSFTNFYSYEDPANESRRHNLDLYLREMSRRRSTTLLLGEAPGYRGTRVTGVPFVSEAIMANGVPTLSLFGSDRGYRSPSHNVQRREATSTIMWRVLSELRHTPLLWAAFPFHPHEPGNKDSNRAPTSVELRLGRQFVERLLDMWDITRVVAVGNVAARTLGAMQIPATKVRHPSRGGASAFEAGLRALN
jgi:uracil-DNA glycosylase